MRSWRWHNQEKVGFQMCTLIGATSDGFAELLESEKHGPLWVEKCFWK